MDFSKLFNDEYPKEFYDFIYGSVHHHSYASGRADYLIERFGKVKFLDIGCACGILVKELRERGAEAWGIEVSEYALSQSCAPEWCVSGSITDIPFDDNSFDVVHSQAVIGYQAETDLDKLIGECKRVGNKQFHSIDTNCPIPAYGYKFMKPLDYWQGVFPDGIG